jgi:hypothetical protein
MSSFRAGQWFIGLCIYWIILFLVTFSVQQSIISINGIEQCIYNENPELLAFNTTYLTYGGKCVNPPTETFLTATFPSGDMNIRCSQYDGIECDNFKGCVWENSSGWLSYIDDGKCAGLDPDNEFVNASYYGWNTSSDDYTIDHNTRLICEESTVLSTSSIVCEQFSCTWLDNSEVQEQFELKFNVKQNAVQFFESIKFIFGYDVNICGMQFNFIFQIFFVWLPFLMLIYSVVMLVRG